MLSFSSAAEFVRLRPVDESPTSSRGGDLSSTPRLRLSDAAIRRAAERFGPRSPPALLYLQAAWSEARLRFARRIEFRRGENAAACSAYEAMRVGEFTDINSLQAWANWRTIPRNLNGRLPLRPILALDLCCGVGHSTEVLAFYTEPGSRIFGLEMNGRFVEHARRKTYRHADGRRANVSFRAQSVLDAFRRPTGELLADAEVDLVNAVGAVGCHFDAQATRRLARECGRVVRVGGLAAIDSGREGTAPRELEATFRDAGFLLVHTARSCAFDRRPQLCFRKL